MVEFPFVVSAERKGSVADENLSQMVRLADINFMSSSPPSDPRDKWETTISAATFHARLNVALGWLKTAAKALNAAAARQRVNRPAQGQFLLDFYRLRSTEAGFWFSARTVPGRPSRTVTSRGAAPTIGALPACQTKLRVIRRVTIR